MFGARDIQEFSPRLSPPHWAHRRDEITLKGQVPMAKQSHTEVFAVCCASFLSHC